MEHLHFTCISLCVRMCRILSCLMEHLYTDKMVEDCEHRLLELQYFISRDWKWVSETLTSLATTLMLHSEMHSMRLYLLVLLG